MLRLKLPTDPRWVNIAEKNITEILTDHAFCEQKAASAAISIIVQFPEYPDLVDAMTDLAREEMEHFQRVHDQLKKRGLQLGYERKDPYVGDLRTFFKDKSGGRKQYLINTLLLAAMIEARSCERFRVLSENIADEELSSFYAELMKSEAMHYTMFLAFARKFGADQIDVDALWDSFLEYEAEVMLKYGKTEQIHG
ncbi:tRNA-(ms[2]io[6]A)-hydroxylase [Salibacteraceae bacterium]|jgi:tRNA 2-(methylsulfanyl)-N6-isopentenyladenosine37 hydroxylase|nr:tRNA-(ms[2]io[6]A)-hydroxylase [Salibacteraceae bacterium]MDB9708941.1 tRNA-(ms[2]io[6]A)-hydroxylase [Salibacteraceae bacterium]HAQ69625.1 tRNA 2-methylthio-N6-isopentenyl adenosine(37) hydroxylase MiaE [Flavobacteriales bacterium]